jgi:hypothetical protein
VIVIASQEEGKSCGVGTAMYRACGRPGNGIKQWKEEANDKMQEEGQLINDKLKRLGRERQVKKVQWKAWSSSTTLVTDHQTTCHHTQNAVQITGR